MYSSVFSSILQDLKTNPDKDSVLAFLDIDQLEELRNYVSDLAFDETKEYLKQYLEDTEEFLNEYIFESKSWNEHYEIEYQNYLDDLL